MSSMNGVISNDLEGPLTQISRTRSTLNISETVQNIDI